MRGSLGNCLVLGGGGFLGQELVKLLLAEGFSVRSFSRHKYPELEALGVECLCGSINDYEVLRRACEGCDTLFHTASICDIMRSRHLYFDVNVRGTENVLKACLDTGVSRLVYTSTPSVVVGGQDIICGDESLPYPPRYSNPYPESKAIAEKAVLAAGKSGQVLTCALRPHLIWGKRDPHIIPRLFELAEKGLLRIVGEGSNQVSITHVKNAAFAHILAAKELAGQGRCAGRAYFVNDTEPVNLWDWINNLLRIADKPTVNKHISHGLLRSLGWLNEITCACLPFLGAPRLTRFVADQLAHSHSFSHARATRDFAYAPIVSPQEGLMEFKK